MTPTTISRRRNTLISTLQRWLPSGSQLSEELQRQRHHLIVSTLGLMIPILATVGLVNHRPLVNGVWEIGLAVVVPLLAAIIVKHKRARAAIAAFGLMSSAAVLVDLSGGKVEAHFMFFVLLPLVALYQDWLPFLVAIGVVVGHHAIIGTFEAKAVYDHMAAQHSPVLWAGIHASFVVALVIILIIHWNAAEASERALRDALVDLESTQDQLVQAQKLESLGQMAAGIAHEINTPIQFVGDNIRFLATAFDDLTAVVGNLDELLAATRDRPELVEIAQRADQQRADSDIAYLIEEIPLAVNQSLGGIDKVAEIVRALKGVAHPDSDKLTTVDVNKLIADTVVVSRNEWRHTAVLTTAFDETLPTVSCAPGPISQVVLNLIVNAAHAIQDRFGETSLANGNITISTRTDEASIVVTVADNGGGMSEAVRSRIFDPFFTTKGVGRGTGQGLAISHAVIVKQHGGTIDVASVIGEGTTFTLRVPIEAIRTMTPV